MRLDDDTYLETSSSHLIGEIKLVITRTTVPKVVVNKRRSTIYDAPPHLEKVHERSKKAMDHRVKYVASITLYDAQP
jgi:hypothetical protein